MVVIPTKSRAVQLCDTASLSTLSAQKTAQTLLIIFFANLQTRVKEDGWGSDLVGHFPKKNKKGKGRNLKLEAQIQNSQIAK